jgi:hypothetical protein
MKKNLIKTVLVFLLLSGTTVYAQNSQTGVKKEITDHSEQTDKLPGKKIQQETLANGKFEKLDAPATVKNKQPKKKKFYKRRKKH